MGYMLHKKRGVICILSVVFIILTASLTYSGPQDNGCCTEPSYVSAIGGCDLSSEQDCCGGAEDYDSCVQDYFNADTTCQELAVCQQQQGCCTDVCQPANMKALCSDRSSFVPGSCEDTGQCGKGCCKCVNTEDTEDVFAIDHEVTEQECIEECDYYDTVSADYQVSVFDTSIPLDECIVDDSPSEPDETGTINATVLDADTQDPLSSALVQAGPESCTTGSQGTCSITLNLGTYGVTASKTSEGYASQAKTVVLDTADQVKSVDFELSEGEQAVISGTVTRKDTGDPIRNAKIYLDDNLVVATDDNGEYSYAAALGQYTIQARASGFQDSQETDIDVSSSLTVDFDLSFSSEQCEYPSAKPVNSFSAEHVPGESAVSLEWDPPGCSNIAGYFIKKEGVRIKYLAVKSEPYVNPTNYKDEDVEWGQAYTYCIEVDYHDNAQRYSSEVCTDQITLGNELCEDRFRSGTFTEFCLDRYKRAVCNAQNQVITPPSSSANPVDCSVIGQSWFCTGPDYAGETKCKDQGACSAVVQQATPFGLFFNEVACYGSNDQNYCYYDFSESVVDACFPCEANMTCFDYISENACDKDNCEAAGFENECRWQQTSYSGLGKGICYPEEYESDDQCYRCSEENDVFKNTGCTQDVCSSLGACFADADESNCLSCLESGCSGLPTRETCTGGTAFSIGSSMESFTSSQDICNLGKCRWDPAENLCFKDGNDNRDPDCDAAGTDRVAGGNLGTECRRDVTPPETRTKDPNPKIISDSRLFLISSSDAETLHFCIDKKDECIPDMEVEFTDSIAYLEKEDLISSNDVLRSESGNFYLRYYATDSYYNQELLRSTPVFADLIPPEISVSSDLEPQTVTDPVVKSDLTFNISLNEFAQCTDQLITISENCGEDESGCDTESKLSERNDRFSVTYTIPDGRYKYRVECEDDHGNTGTYFNESIDIDAFRYIDIISPNGAIHDTSVTFEIGTVDNSVCQLKENNDVKLQFDSSDQLTHTAGPLELEDNSHYNIFRAVCRDLVDQSKVDDKLFYFTVDNLAPVASAHISSGRLYFTANESLQKYWAGESSDIDFTCTDPMISSFGCNASDVKYCVTDINSTCNPDTYYHDTLHLEDSKKIMYFGEDKGGNQEDVKELIVYTGGASELFLLDPPYNVSQQPTFDVILQTRFESEGCKFSGNDFSYDSITDSKLIFEKISPHKFRLEGFPASLGLSLGPGETYPMNVKCKDTRGFIDEKPYVFDLMYDPSNPEINDLGARPDPVLQGPHVTVFAETDDKTICKLDRNQFNYEMMDHEFEGYEDFGSLQHIDGVQPSFSRYHEKKIAVTSEDSNKGDITYHVACQNRAGKVSAAEDISYSVDFTQSGTIIETSPSGIIKETEVDLEVFTNKDAACEFQEGVFWKPFSSTGGTEHSYSKSLAGEGNYTFPVKCRMSVSQSTVSGDISFIIDNTPPSMSSIEDGNYACGENIHPSFFAEDEHSSIKYFNYSLEDSAGNAITGWQRTSSNNPAIPVDNLEVGETYFIRAFPIDRGGNKGNTVTSDGFIVEESGSELCQSDNTGPEVEIIQEITYKGVKIEMQCKDDTGCSEKFYNKVYGNSTCNPSEPYTAPVYMEDSGTFCWRALDSAGNNITGQVDVIVNDEDQDTVPDEKDNCPDTPAGESVDSEGCSASQKENDQDRDGVDNEHDLCPETPYSEIDLVDEDGCSPSELDQDEDEDGVSNADDACPETPYGEQVDAEGCSASQKDTDGDGMSDDWEQRQGLDPEDPGDALSDPDDDKLSNKEEYDYYEETGRYLRIDDSDTDGDGYNDGEEIESGTDPTNPNDAPEGSNLLAIILIIIGIALIGFGIGYLQYTRKNHLKPSTMHNSPGQAPSQSSLARQQAEAARRKAYMEQQRRAYEARRRAYLEEQRKKQLEKAKRSRQEKEKKRSSLFDLFTGEKEKKKDSGSGKGQETKTKEPASGKEEEKDEKNRMFAEEHTKKEINEDHKNKDKNKDKNKEGFLGEKPEEKSKGSKERELGPEFQRILDLAKSSDKKKSEPLVEIKRMPETKDEFQRLKDVVEERLEERKSKSLTRKEKESAEDVFSNLEKISKDSSKREDVFNQLKQMGIKTRKPKTVKKTKSSKKKSKK